MTTTTDHPKAVLVRGMQAAFRPRSNAGKGLANVLEWLLTDEAQALLAAAKGER